MAATDTFPLVDRLIPGGLPKFLLEARAAGESFETIAFRLRSEHDVTVGSETVRRWFPRAEAAIAEAEEVAAS